MKTPMISIVRTIGPCAPLAMGLVVSLLLLAQQYPVVGAQPSPLHPAGTHLRYHVTNLGPFTAAAINNRGQVLLNRQTIKSPAGNGLEYDPGPDSFTRQTYLWQGGHRSQIGPFSGFESADGVGIDGVFLNNAGQVIGDIQIYGVSEQAPPNATLDASYFPYLWQSGHFQRLDTPRRDQSLTFPGQGERLLNDRGQVVLVTIDNGSSDSLAFPGGNVILWDHGRQQELGQPYPSGSSMVNALNNRGLIVGQDRSETSSGHAFCWQILGRGRGAGGHKRLQGRDLGTLGGRMSAAYDINDAGWIVGLSDTKENSTGRFEEHACLWHNGRVQDLGTLPGQTYSGAAAINSRGQIVGQSGSRAFLYQAGRMRDLNDLIPAGAGWVLTKAIALNDQGQIVGDGTFHGRAVSFLLTPTRN